MRMCPFCNNKVSDGDNFCKFCGSNVSNINNSSNNKDNIKTFFIIAVIFTIIYLIVYLINCCVWGWINELGNRLSVGESSISPLRDFASICVISMVFSFSPWFTATIFSFLSKKKLLIFFNVLIMLVNLFFLFLDSFLFHVN